MSRIKYPPVKHLESNKWCAPGAEPYEISGCALMCAVCRRGGGEKTPVSDNLTDPFLEVIWNYPHIPVKVLADLDVTRAHFFDVYENRGKKPLPAGFAKRRENFLMRRKDLEVCRLLGIYPNTVMPAYFIYDLYRLIYEKIDCLYEICGWNDGQSTTTFWAPCGSHKSNILNEAREEGFFSG